MEYNTDRKLESFQFQIDLIKANGFNPIAVAQIWLEDTFVFETEEEAEKAYRILECSENGDWIGKVVGWWYGRESFKKAVEEYESQPKGEKVRIFSLNGY